MGTNSEKLASLAGKLVAGRMVACISRRVSPGAPSIKTSKVCTPSAFASRTVISTAVAASATTGPMSHDVIIVGGGIGGSAAALRAAQYHMRVGWLRGDKTTAKRSRSQWVANIDNMIGIHDGMVRKKILKLLRGNTAAQQAIEAQPHLHISTRDIVSNTAQRIEESYAERVQMAAAAPTGPRRSGCSPARAPTRAPTRTPARRSAPAGTDSW